MFTIGECGTRSQGAPLLLSSNKKDRLSCEKRSSFVLKESDYRIPCSTIDLATFMKPAMFAPFI